MQFSAATRRLKSALGPSVVRTGAETWAASFDSSKIAFEVDAVVLPRTREDVARVLELANQARVPVTVRGRGTSLTGSASPRRGGWVLDLHRWKRVRIDAMAGMAHVEAGATVERIQAAAQAKGWFYPPDPSSRKYCTIGGNIACNAGGMHGGRYGVTRDFVLALKGFLPTGEWVEWGRATKKFSAGFNLRDLWIGSEGMLGVVTDAVLRLIPRPEARWTLLVSFDSEPGAFRAALALFSLRAEPAICEFLDRYSVECAERATGRAVFAGQAGRPVLLIEFAGSRAEVRARRALALRWARRHGAAHREASGRAEAERLWEVRRACSGAMFQMGDSKLNEDVVLPMGKYLRFAKFLEGLRRSSGLPIPTFGHLADGNLHVNVMYNKADARQSAAAERAVEELMGTVVSLGGAISGEHGIGLAKTPFLRLQHSPAAIRAMRAVKRALDPRGILNPGKMFEVFRVWKSPRVSVRLPWDHA
ncbi:MAG TPA: FAD-linked oxidase C-terminal domain-containing protein [Opitutaceae bacterium]|jgi:glycolate oxidase